MEKQLYDNFKEKFISTLGFMSLAVVSISIIWVSTIFSFIENEIDSVVFLFSSILEFFIIAFTVGLLWPYYLDYRLIRRKKFRIIEGIVVDFHFFEDGTEVPTTYSYPIIQDEKNDQKIMLELNQEVIYEERYQIFYLPNTQIGVVAKKL